MNKQQKFTLKKYQLKLFPAYISLTTNNKQKRNEKCKDKIQ